MLMEDEIRQLKLRKDGEPKRVVSDKEDEGIGGRRAILLLFFLTIFLSLIFWLQRNIAQWLAEVIGPSKWTFTR